MPGPTAGVRAPPRPPCRANGGTPGNLLHPASGQRGTCSAPAAPGTEPQRGAGLLARRGDPAPVGGCPGHLCLTGRGERLPLGTCVPGTSRAQAARRAPIPAHPEAAAATWGPSTPRPAVPCAAPAAAGGPPPAGCRARGPRET